MINGLKTSLKDEKSKTSVWKDVDKSSFDYTSRRIAFKLQSLIVHQGKSEMEAFDREIRCCAYQIENDECLTKDLSMINDIWD